MLHKNFTTYRYMTQLEPIFDMDKTIFCVNAFNHLSYPHTAKDPTLLYRVETFPAYGWMMSRKTLREIIPKWLPVEAVSCKIFLIPDSHQAKSSTLLICHKSVKFLYLGRSEA